MPKEKKKSILSTFGDVWRERIAETQRPDVYPDQTDILSFTEDVLERGKNFLLGKTVEEQNKQGGLNPVDEFSTAAWKKYLQQPDSGIVRESEFRPSQSKDENEKFFTLEDETTGRGLRNDLLEFLKEEKRTGQDISYPFHTSDISLKDTGFSLGHFELNKGEDERGKYISARDRYDFDINKKDSFLPKNIADKFSGGEPFNVYDRLYYTDEDLEDSSPANAWGL
jgi:hypothetical protein